MGYNIDVYCEPEIYCSKEVQIDIEKQNFSWSETTNGYFLFGDYRIYHEKCVIFRLCEFFNNDFYKYFNPLAYIEDLDEVDEDSLKWKDLKEVSKSLESFLRQLQQHRRTLPIESIISDCEGFSKSRFSEYYKNNLIPEVEQAKSFIEIFEKYGAKKIVFGYS